MIETVTVVFMVSDGGERVGDTKPPAFQKQLTIDRPFIGEVVRVKVAGKDECGRMRTAILEEGEPPVIFLDGVAPDLDTAEERTRLRMTFEADPAWKPYKLSAAV